MAIADTINSMKTNITNAYNAIQTKGGTIPTNKNLENLSTAINSITGGSSGGIEDVATVASLKAKVTGENIGKLYKYTGISSDGFEKNELYSVVENSGGGYNVLGLGKVIYNTTKYTVTYNYTACGDDAGSSVNNMPLGGIMTVDVYTGIGPYVDYVLPNTITVSGCQYTWTLNTDKKQGTLKLYNPTGNITVTIAAEKAQTTLKANAATIMKMFNQDLMMKPAMDLSTATTFAKNYDALNAGYQKYFTDFYSMMTNQALPLMRKGTAAAYDEVYALIVKGDYWRKCGWSVKDVTITKDKGLDITLNDPVYEFIWLSADLKN